MPGHAALTANITLLSGALHALFLQYDSCPRYVLGDPYRSCEGLCDVAWLTQWDHITADRVSEPRAQLQVSMGESLALSDKRRAGPWYVGVKALPNEAATYVVSIGLTTLPPVPTAPFCGSYTRFCASATTRLAGDAAPLTTAADTRSLPLQSSPAALRVRCSRAYWPTLLALAVALKLSHGRSGWFAWQHRREQLWRLPWRSRTSHVI